MSKLWSRKLWMAIAGAVGILIAEYAATGTITEKGIAGSTAVIVAYLASQGYVDKGV